MNTADATALETLNGVGEVLAAAIITYRDEQGPFTASSSSRRCPGIGPSTLEEIRDQVTIWSLAPSPPVRWNARSDDVDHADAVRSKANSTATMSSRSTPVNVPRAGTASGG